jgi:kynureninase
VLVTRESVLAEAARLDAADPLAAYRDRFVGTDGDAVLAYLDGNSRRSWRRSGAAG